MSAPAGKITTYSRSRQTVVCTECKRLKIRCDRQSPCSGCAKRSNDPRVCVYLTANTERPDIGVLWSNQQEAELKIDSLAVRVDEIQESFLPRRITVPPMVIISSANGTPNVFPLDCISALWITTLGIPITRVDALVNTGPPPQTSRLFVAEESPQLYASFFPPDPNLPSGSRQRAVITSNLLKQLPSPPAREALLSSLNSTLILHPICSFHHLERRLRYLDDPQHKLQTTTDITVAFFAVAAAAMTLGSLAYQAERRAWKLQPDFPDSERDITRLFDLARLAIRLAGDTEEDRNDVMLALLLLIIFTLHSLELDGHNAVVSGVASTPIHQQLGQLMDQLRRKADSRSLLLEVAPPPGQTLWNQQRRRILAAAVAYYDFHVSDLIGNKLTIDAESYTTEAPAPVDDRVFKPTSTNLPPAPNGNAKDSTLFATHRSKTLKSILQSRSEMVFVRDKERALMTAAAEAASPQPAKTVDDIERITPLQSPAPDVLEMWDDRLHQQRENLPRPMLFDTSAEFAADVGVVFAGEPRQPGPYEPCVSLAHGYSMAQQAELSVFVSYHRMRNAALLLENMLVYKPRGAPPHGTGTVSTVRVLDAAQELLATLRIMRHVLKKKMPLSLSNYSYGKRIFDAGVIFGVLSCISASRSFERNTMRAAAEGLVQCIDLLKDLESWLRVKEGVPEPTTQTATQDLSPPRRVLEELADRAGIKIVDGIIESLTPRRKRTAIEMEESDQSWDGLILPYIMGGWVVGKSPAAASWIGHRAEHVEANTQSAVAPPAAAAIAAPVTNSPVEQDEHRNKKARRIATGVGGVGAAISPQEVLAGDSSTDSGSQFSDPKARRRTSDGSGGRPASARAAIVVRARVADQRPKRKNPAAHTPSSNKKPKTEPEAPMEAVEEEYVDRFAYNLPQNAENTQRQAVPVPTPVAAAAPAPTPAPVPAPVPVPVSVSVPAPVPQPQTTPQYTSPDAHAQAMAQQHVFPSMPAPKAAPPPKSTPPAVEPHSSNESPITPGYGTPVQQGYTNEWSEAENQNMYAQQMMSNQRYQNAPQFMLAQNDNVYMSAPHQHQPPAPAPQQQPHQQMNYTPQQQVQHNYQPMSVHPSHLHYPQYGYSGGGPENHAGRPHPHLSIDPNMVAAAGSQPTSAVAAGEPAPFYQNINPTQLYSAPPQEQYAQQPWNQQFEYSGY